MHRRLSRHRLSIEHLEHRHLLSITPLAGDYSGNNSVGSEDYNLWAQTYGSTTELSADGNSDGRVDAADFTLWRDNLGNTRTPAPFLNLCFDTLDETAEDAAGAVVFRNSDFSKETLYATQPEAGLPLYIPDYMAEPAVYDPNAVDDFSAGSVRIDESMLGATSVTFTFGGNVRLWTTDPWDGLTDVGGGRYQIPTGVALNPTSVHLDFQVEGLESSATFATDTVTVTTSPIGGMPLADSANYTVVNTAIGVDGNRDTKIDFANSHDRQLLFWLNNDEEGQHPTDEEAEFEDVTITAADNTDSVIGQRRDLEDLAPLRLDIDPLLVDNTFNTAGPGTPGSGALLTTYSLSLEESGGTSLRLFNSNSTANEVLEHLNDDFVADVQAEDAFWREAVASSFTVNMDLADVIGGLNAYLIEAIGGSYGTGFSATPTLVFTTSVEYANGRPVENRQEVELDLRDIKELYTRWDIDYFAGATDLRQDPTFMHFATPTTPTHQSQVTDVPFWDSDETAVYVHGWNNSDDPMADDKAAGAETLMKRLYWHGFRGEFVSFNWPTFTDREAGLSFFGLQESIEWLALSYNPSDFQAYRSAQALKDILAGYRGEAPDLHPVHLMAHSMGNIVASEAMRLWAFDVPFHDDPLVTNYVAMEAAVSAGAWGDDGTDSRIVGRPIRDLYRFWSHGRDGFSDPSLGVQEYFAFSDFSAENMINMYNEDDYALGWWDYNNDSKNMYIESNVWIYDYSYTEGAGGNTNTDTFLRVDDDPEPDAETMLTLTNPNGMPGPNAYEILAFFAQSASLAVGVKPVDEFDTNINIEAYGMLHGSDILANHSYQFSHDAAETWQFFTDVRSATGFLSTHDSMIMVLPAESLSGSVMEPLGRFAYPSPVREDEDSGMESFDSVAASPIIVSDDDDDLLLAAAYRPSERSRDVLDEGFAHWHVEEQEEPEGVDAFAYELVAV